MAILATPPSPRCLPRPTSPPATVPALVGELAGKGTRAAVVITAGIRGDLQQSMLDAACRTCFRIQGPNCLGLMVPGIGLNASFSHRAPLAGNLAFVSQSGALITAVIDWAAGRNIGFSHVVSLGDMADVDFGDLLDYLAGDIRSRAILLYMESLTHAAKFMSAARRAARVKPVIVIKSGRHAAGAKAALSHTGALSGFDAAYDAAFRRAGLLRVDRLEDLFEAAEMIRPACGSNLMETSMAQAQTLKARLALPPVRQEGSPHFSGPGRDDGRRGRRRAAVNIAALALKRELFARYRAYMERETLGHERFFTSLRRTLGAPRITPTAPLLFSAPNNSGLVVILRTGRSCSIRSGVPRSRGPPSTSNQLKQQREQQLLMRDVRAELLANIAPAEELTLNGTLVFDEIGCHAQ